MNKYNEVIFEHILLLKEGAGFRMLLNGNTKGADKEPVLLFKIIIYNISINLKKLLK